MSEETLTERFQECEISVTVDFNVRLGRYLAQVSIQRHDDVRGETLDFPVAFEQNQFSLREDAIAAGFAVGRKVINDGIDWSNASPKQD